MTRRIYPLHAAIFTVLLTLLFAATTVRAVDPVTGGAAAGSDGWETDYTKALARAKAENKPMLLDFTGSDWCGWCMKLEADVFSRSKWQNFAKLNMVLVKLDFPRKKALPAELTRQNNALNGKYKITGFPTMLLLSPDEKELDRIVGFIRDGNDKVYVDYYTRQLKAASFRAIDTSSPLDDSRLWTDNKGRSMKASLLVVDKEGVVLHADDGRILDIPFKKLSNSDTTYARGKMPKD